MKQEDPSEKSQQQPPACSIDSRRRMNLHRCYPTRFFDAAFYAVTPCTGSGSRLMKHSSEIDTCKYERETRTQCGKSGVRTCFPRACRAPPSLTGLAPHFASGLRSAFPARKPCRAALGANAAVCGERVEGERGRRKPSERERRARSVSVRCMAAANCCLGRLPRNLPLKLTF